MSKAQAMSAGDNKQYVGELLIWLGIYLFISIAISFVFRFPMSLVVFFVVFLLIQFVRAYVRNKKSGKMKFRDFFSPSSSSSMFGFRPVKYYCMNCGTPHNLRECPKCGSRSKRVGWTHGDARIVNGLKSSKLIRYMEVAKRSKIWQTGNSN